VEEEEEEEDEGEKDCVHHSPSPPADLWLATSISVQAGSLLTTTGAH